MPDQPSVVDRALEPGLVFVDAAVGPQERQSRARRVLGCFSDERSSVYPDAPTLREQGEDVTPFGWYGFMAPAATSDPIVERTQSEVGQALSDTDIKQKLAVQGLDAHYLPGEGFGKFIDSESEKWGRIIREAGINKP